MLSEWKGPHSRKLAKKPNAGCRLTTRSATRLKKGNNAKTNSHRRSWRTINPANRRSRVGCTGWLGEHHKPVNRDAAKILRRVYPSKLKTEWTKADEEASRWAGLISKCPRCGDRAYEHGYCFGCGKPLGVGDGDRRSPNAKMSDGR